MSGIAHPNFKTGIRSAAMPKALLDQYLVALDDPQLMSVRPDLALLETHLAKALEGLGTGESRSCWQRITEQKREMEQGRDAGDKARQGAALQQIMLAIDDGAREMESRHEIERILLIRQKIIRSDRKAVATDKVMAMISALVESIRRHVTDRQQLQGLQNDLTKILRFR